MCLICQEERLARFFIDAGRVLFLSLKFDKACQLLERSNIDPRELIALYPELQVLAHVTVYVLHKVMSLTLDVTCGPHVRQAEEFNFQTMYFSPELTQGIVVEAMSPADGASSANDTNPGLLAAGGGRDIKPASLTDIIRAVLKRFGTSESTKSMTEQTQELFINSLEPLCRFLEQRRAAAKVCSSRCTFVAFKASDQSNSRVVAWMLWVNCQDSLNGKLQEALDTAIFKAYVLLGRSKDLEK